MSTLRSLYLLSVRHHKPFSLVAENMPYKVQKLLQWYMADKDDFSESSLSMIEAVTEGTVAGGAGAIFYKNTPTRKIYRLELDESTVVVKSFSFRDSWSRKLFRHKFYAFDEAANLIHAKNKGVPVPKLLAFAEQKGAVFCYQSLVVMEYAENTFHPTDVFSGQINSDISKDLILERVGNLLLSLYYAGCNHIDTHGSSFLIHRLDEEKDVVIDLQFAVFHHQPRPNILSYQLSHLVRSINAYFERSYLDEWAHSILERVENNDVEYQYLRYKRHLEEKIPTSYERMMMK